MKLMGVVLTREVIKDALTRLDVWMGGTGKPDEGVAHDQHLLNRVNGTKCQHGVHGQCPFCERERDKHDPEPSR